MPLEQMGGLRRLAAGLLLAVMLPVGRLLPRRRLQGSAGKV